MKRFANLWPQVVGFDNLYLAYRKARKGKQAKTAVAEFGLNLESELPRLQRELEDGSYRPGSYRQFTIYEHKPRLISAAPFRDRVVHHALLNVVEPLLDKRFIADSYACRKGKGVHQAVTRYQQWAKQYRYALKMDIRQYFPSVDHALLKAKLARHIKDRRALELFARIIDGAQEAKKPPVWFPGDNLFTPLERRAGLPIGNLTSQFLANLYLDDLDQFIKCQLRIPAYLRYVDDFIVLGNDKTELAELRETIREFLLKERLRLHPCKAHIVPVWRGLDVLGYRVFPGIRRLRNANGHRFVRKLRRFARGYAAGRLAWADFDPSVQSWLGHAQHADTENLRETIFSAIVFRRESGNETACYPGRLLEQQPVQAAVVEPQQQQAV